MRLYLDNCCFNRPFDNQKLLLIYLETEAKLFIQEEIKRGAIELVWSFVIDYENDNHPFLDISEKIREWRSFATVDMNLTDEIAQKARELMRLGLRQNDAAHVACAISAKAAYFITTDKRIINKRIQEITVLNPIDFVRRYTNAE
jgi:predicted nucleic acid-binding protein